MASYLAWRRKGQLFELVRKLVEISNAVILTNMEKTNLKNIPDQETCLHVALHPRCRVLLTESKLRTLTSVDRIIWTFDSFTLGEKSPRLP